MVFSSFGSKTDYFITGTSVFPKQAHTQMEIKKTHAFYSLLDVNLSIVD